MLGDVHDEDLVLGNAHCLCRRQGRPKYWFAGEEGPGPGRPELVLQFAGRVGHIGGRGNAVHAVYGVQHPEIIDLPHDNE